MFHETFHDDGLAHLSYLVGDGGIHQLPTGFEGT